MSTKTTAVVNAVINPLSGAASTLAEMSALKEKQNSLIEKLNEDRKNVVLTLPSTLGFSSNEETAMFILETLDVKLTDKKKGGRKAKVSLTSEQKAKIIEEMKALAASGGRIDIDSFASKYGMSTSAAYHLKNEAGLVKHHSEQHSEPEVPAPAPVAHIEQRPVKKK